MSTVKCLWGFFTSTPEILSAIASLYPHLMDEVGGVKGFWGEHGNSPIKWRELEVLVYGDEGEEPISNEVPCVYSIYQFDDKVEFFKCNEGYTDGDTTLIGTVDYGTQDLTEVIKQFVENTLQ